MSDNQKKSSRRSQYQEFATNNLLVIGGKLRDEIPLEKFERDFIADALLKIANGEKAEKALGLPNTKPIKITWKVRMKIWNEVEKLEKDPRFLHKSSGKPNHTPIFKELASRDDMRKLLKDKDGEPLKASRIHKIYYGTKKYMEMVKEIYYDDPSYIEQLKKI